MGYSDFPFNIEQIALDLLNLKERHRGAVSFDVDCPFCGRRGKMNIHIPKNTYRCNFCDDGSKGSKSSGGMLDLYANVLGGMNLSEAYREICEQLGVAGYSSGQQRTPRELWIREPSKKPPDIPQSEPAPPDVRHRTYSYLFSLLTLNPQHKESLLRRGLTEEQIRHYGYKSTPVLGFTRLAAAVMEHGCTVAGVPGFYVNTSGEWTTNFQAKCPGFLVPVRDMNGRIQAAQIRLDHPAGTCKYIWFSSSERVLGIGSGSPVHFVGDPHAKTITFTEGGLKGTITHCLTGETLICNAGAGQSENIIKLFPQLKANGVEEILSGYDMDLESNEHVRRGCVKILSAARAYGFRAKRRQWDPVNKGIDDHFWAEKLRKILLERLKSEWPEETAPAIRQWVAANLQTYHFCSDTLVYLHFDKPMAYLAEKAVRLQNWPFQQLVAEIDRDRKREGK